MIALPSVGATVMVRGSFGAGLPLEVVVIGIGAEGADPVIDYRDNYGRRRWAYTHQLSAPPPAQPGNGTPRPGLATKRS